MLAAGMELGPYKIISHLGGGGMGEVYRAKDLRLGREVAIKVLSEKFTSDSEALNRFEREARAVAALSHPNILAIHDIGKDQNISFTVTELLAGETLRGRLGKGALPWRKSAELAASVADGLAAAHAKGIIHRDVKPENIFLTSDGHTKLLDFGLVRLEPREGSAQAETAEFSPSNTNPGTVMGTAGYMSPEQVRGQEVDARSDIFSLGCVLYEMATGQRAFSRPTAAETMTTILHDEPPEPSESGKKIPLELQRVIRHCLEKNREERFQSARDLAFDLRTLLTGSGAIQALGGVSGRRRAAGIVLLATALLGLALLAYFYFLSPRDSGDRHKTQGTSQAIESVAVLHLLNVGKDPNTDYLCEGLTDSLINSLSQIPKLKVKSSSSVRRYKGRDVQPETVGEELGVQAVLSGRLNQRGDNLTISLELVDARDGVHLWGQSYQRKLDDVLKLHEEIVREITDKLRLQLTGEEKQRLSRRATENNDAYRAYLQGRFFWNKRTEEAFTKAIGYFQQAIEKDPTFALAYVGLGDAYALLSDYNFLPPREAIPKAKSALSRALELDPTLGEAHAPLAMIRFRYDFDWAAAEKEFRHAIALSPNYATAHHWYGYFLTAAERFDDAERELKRAQELDPLSLIINANLGFRLLLARKYEPAIEQCQKVLGMDANFAVPHSYLGRAYEQLGKHDLAIAAFQEAVKLSGGNREFTAGLAHAYGQAGKSKEARKFLDELVHGAAGRYVPPVYVAIVHLGLRDNETAFQWLHKAYQQRDSALTYLRVDPRFDPVRSDPRYAELLKQVGLGTPGK